MLEDSLHTLTIVLHLPSIELWWPFRLEQAQLLLESLESKREDEKSSLSLLANFCCLE